jgi:hypothetical protein
MSTQINQYLIYGVKLDYNEESEKHDEDALFEHFERFTDNSFTDEMNPNGLHCLFDGMNGDYILVGRCLKKSANHEMIEGFTIAPIEPAMTDMLRSRLKTELGLDVKETDLALHFITHYS